MLMAAWSRFHLEAATESKQQTVRDTRPFFIAWVLYCVVVLALGNFALRNISQSFDFRSFYAAGYLMRTGRSDLYDLSRQQEVQRTLISPSSGTLPFAHPSYEALLYAPFSLLSYGRAYLCYLLFNLLVLAVLFLYAYRLFSSYILLWQPRPGLMFYPFLPLFLAIWQGQNALIFLAICCAVWIQIEKGADFRAGSLLALALFKFHVAVPLAILCAVRRTWRFSAGFLFASAVVVAVCLSLTGRVGFILFLRHVVATSLLHDQSQAAQLAISVFPGNMVNLVGLLSPITQHLQAGLAFAAIAGVSLALTAVCLYQVRVAEDERVAFAIAVLCSMLVSYHLFISDASLILLPLALLARRLSRLLLLAIYAIPPLVVLGMGRGWNFLLAIPTIWMLVAVLRMVRRPGISIEPAAG